MSMFFTTSTIKEWYPLLKQEKFRNIVISSIEFLINEERIKLLGYVIMPNHLHMIFQLYVRIVYLKFFVISINSPLNKF